jgi:ATP-binding cassette subfamily B protein
MSQKSQEKLAEISNSAQENYSGIRVVKAFAREESEIDRFRSLAEGYKKINTDFAWLRGRYLGFLTLSAELGIVVMLIIGGSWVINGTLTKGTLMAFTAYLFMLIWPMIAMGWLITLIQRGLSCLDRIVELLDMPPEPDGSDQVEKINEIEIRDLTFAYDARPVLRNVNAVIRAGERVAIVGKTGCGKTTLANLLLRMYEPPKGSILINGRDINSISLENIRGMVSMVPQDSFLFQDTVSENIRFGAKNGISEEKINYFSNLSRIAQDVETFPLRYSQLIGERGVVLSGGQKQRLSITRAIAREPQVLILDDAFSNIDSNTEKDLLSGLLRDLKDRTIILITHRFSSVKEMDRILVMSDGQIVEDGSHEELIDKKGRYFTMFEKYNLTREIQEA